MSIAFVDRGPEKQEIERLRQLLGRYDQQTLPSLLFQIHSPLREIIAEAFGISSDLLYDSPNENPKGNLDYKIVLNPKIDFGAVKVVWYPFTAYWEYLSRFNVNMENYRDYPTAVGVATVDLLYRSDGQLDLSKSSFLDLTIEKGNHGLLSQYSYYADPRRLRWYFYEVPDKFGSCDFLVGEDIDTVGEDIDTVFSIRIDTNDMLRYFNELKEPTKTKRRKRNYNPIRIEYFLSQQRRVWHSDIFRIEPLSASQILQFHTTTAAKEQKEAALSKLEEYIRTDPEEREFQKLLAENKWVFGHEYSEFLDKRALVIDSQQDFVGRRVTDGFWDIIEIKRSLDGINLFKEDKSHNTLYPGVELSKAIGQVIHYIDRIDRRHDSILIDRDIDTNKVRVKLIIGRDGDDRQVSALHNLNSHLNRIEIRTYDQLLKGARSHLADY